MTWTTWRLNRLAFIMGLLVVAAIAAFLVPIGLQKIEIFRGSGIKSLVDSGSVDPSVAQGFIDSYGGLTGILPVFLPMVFIILGVILASPLVMELEQRTYRLAWTQSFTRRHWFLTKLGFALSGAAVFGSVLSFLFAWWYGPLDSLQGPFRSFNLEGIVPVAYTILSLTLALFIGAMSRKTIVVVVVVMLVVLPVWGEVMTQLRGNYVKPVERMSLLSEKQPLPHGAWLLDVSFADEQGNQLRPGPLGTGVRPRVSSTVDSNERYVIEKYQPADRFWTFQAIESAILLGASILLIGAAMFVVERRTR